MLVISVILAQVLIFAILIYVFRHIMTQNVLSATKHLDELSQDYESKEQEAAKELEGAKQKSQEIITQAQDEAEKSKTQIIEEAQKEKDNLLKEARSRSEKMIQQADKSRKLLISELQERIGKEAIDKACELIQSSLPDKFKQEVHAQWIEDLLQNGFNQLERLRIPEGIQEIEVTSAFSLTEGQRKELTKRIRTLLGKDMTLKEKIDPKVVVGIVVSIGSLVLDGSLKNKIQEQVKNMGTKEEK